MHASNDDNYTIFNEEDAQRAHRLSKKPAQMFRTGLLLISYS